jgi:peroxiredoxin
VELRKALDEAPDLRFVWVMASNQINERTLRFVDEWGLRDRMRLASDPESAAIRALGLMKEDPETIEAGVPHPATYLLDADGIVRFADVRRDFHVWLDPQKILDAWRDLR